MGLKLKDGSRISIKKLSNLSPSQRKLAKDFLAENLDNTKDKPQDKNVRKKNRQTMLKFVAQVFIVIMSIIFIVLSFGSAFLILAIIEEYFYYVIGFFLLLALYYKTKEWLDEN